MGKIEAYLTNITNSMLSERPNITFRTLVPLHNDEYYKKSIDELTV